MRLERGLLSLIYLFVTLYWFHGLGVFKWSRISLSHLTIQYISTILKRCYKLQSNFNGSKTDGSFTIDYSNSFLSPYGIFPIAQEKKILKEIFLFYCKIVCCVYSLESPHRGDSNEYTQYTIILLKIENISINYRHLLPDLAPWLNLTGSNYPSLEQISMVQKMFESLKFDCIQIVI